MSETDKAAYYELFFALKNDKATYVMSNIPAYDKREFA